eukprot:TRINITY_DN2828_c0_g1_i1.p2 TRINITY_DN2828_c0_g1~~TRINITY_DN2828_c0_g1_i1.p2  ORF type:complete len:411 (+),score=126.84 TRINITY_DN2828_c0_g1_i1:38-1234(+)
MADLTHIKDLITKLRSFNHEMFKTDYLRTWDKSDDDILAIATVSQILEELHKANISPRLYDSGLAVSNFRDNSTRTRFSFASAASMLGLTVNDMDESKSQVAHGETVRETANMISFFTELIGIRDDLFIGEGHKYQVEVAEAVEAGFNEGVLNQRPTVINLQCDEDHPTQSMADLLHLIDHFGGVENLKGKKIAMTWAYSPSYGKPLSVPQAIIALMTRFGMDVHLAHPDGYELMPHIMEVAKENAEKSGGKFTVSSSMDEAFENADVVYPKSWAPMFIMEKRTEAYRGGKVDMKALEKEALESNKTYIDWQCTRERMEKTNNATYMHCLPADITGVSCPVGEVDGDVFEEHRVKTYKEASHKLYGMAAVTLLSRVENVADFFDELVENPEKNRRVKA